MYLKFILFILNISIRIKKIFKLWCNSSINDKNSLYYKEEIIQKKLSFTQKLEFFAIIKSILFF